MYIRTQAPSQNAEEMVLNLCTCIVPVTMILQIIVHVREIQIDNFIITNFACQKLCAAKKKSKS